MRHLVTAATGLVGTIALAALAACSDPAGPSSAVPDGPRLGVGPAQKITICHAAGRAGTTKYVSITVSENAASAHLDEHGTPQAGHEQDFLYRGGVACEDFGGSAQGGWTLDKNYLGAFGMNPDGSMFLESASTAPVVIPRGTVSWLKFEIVVTAPNQLATASLTDLAASACNALPAGFLCEALAPIGNPLLVNYTTGITGNFTMVFFIDIKNLGACGVRGVLTNVAQLTPTGSTMFSDAASAMVVAPACT